MRNRQFVFTPKIEYKLVAERSEANQNSLTFPTWCSILKIVRTHFVPTAVADEEILPRKFGKAAPARRSLGAGGEPRRPKPGEKHRLEPYFNFGGRKFFNPRNSGTRSRKCADFCP